MTRGRLLFSILFFVSLVVLAHVSGARSFFAGGSVYLASFPWRIENSFMETLNRYKIFFISKAALHEENVTLKEEVRKLERERLRFKKIEEESVELAALFGGRTREEQPTLLAVILSKPNRSPYDTLLLDVGVEEGVSVGDKVIAYGTVTIGYVDGVYENASRVKLFSSPGEVLEIVIGQENIEAEAHGIGGGNFEVKVPRGIDVKEGDIIAFPAFRIEVLGVIEKIIVSPSDAFQSVLFKSPINLFELKFVEVLVRDQTSEFKGE